MPHGALRRRCTSDAERRTRTGSAESLDEIEVGEHADTLLGRLRGVPFSAESSYTQFFNRRHDRSGHLFQGRYKAFLAWLGREVAKIPVARAARFLGRDTSTMINGVNQLEADMKRDRALRQKLHSMREKVRQLRNNPIPKD